VDSVTLGRTLHLRANGTLPCTPDQLENGQHENGTRVNGSTRQLSSTKMMVFKIRELIEFFSSMTLEPGDVITSGTSGVAYLSQTGQRAYLLRPGDVIESEIESLGRLKNTVVEDKAAYRVIQGTLEDRFADHLLLNWGFAVFPTRTKTEIVSDVRIA